MAPLIDMVFILLIFFMVTTVFTRETGVEINRPQASSSEALDKKSLMIGIDPKGNVYIEQHRVDLLGLRAVVERRLQMDPDRNIVIISDEESRTGILVQVMDECRLAGASNIAIAAKKAQ